MEPTKVIVTLTVEVLLEDQFAPTLAEATESLEERISGFLYPTGMTATLVKAEGKVV